jgi:protein involved in polysaccharide export with SLBB domain
VDAANYVVGPGDRLLVELWGVRDLTTEVEVNAEGRLFVPHVGVFAVGGEKLAKLRDAIIARLKAVYPNLHANVTLARPRTFLVNIVGAVARPGPYQATALTRVSALVPRALPLPTASTRRVELRRKGGGQKKFADIVHFTTLGDPATDPTVLDGDTIFVPVRELEVEVTGAVKHPGRYELVRERDVRELLDLAGGLSNDTATTLPYRLTTRESGDKIVVRSMPAALAEKTVLHPGDILHVPTLADLRRSVVVEGAIVGHPSQTGTGQPEPERRPMSDRFLDPTGTAARDVSVVLPFVEGDRPSDLVVKAGGLQPWADTSAAYLMRADRGRIPVELGATGSKETPDVPIEPGDMLVIPSRREAVVVGGAVQHPGLVPYSRNLHPQDYITLAGGPTRSGLPGSAQVLKRNGQRKKISAVAEVEPGDVISVPEAWLTSAEWVTVVLLLANIAVSSAAVIVTVNNTRSRSP